jgi:predicted transcriptional regulator
LRVKRVKIGIKSLKEGLQDFVKTCKAIERGEKVKKETGIYFEDIEAFRKALTTKRLELLHLIRVRRAHSLQELSRLAGRNIKNVAQDLELLRNLGLIELSRKKAGRKEVTPRVGYDAIELMIKV